MSWDDAAATWDDDPAVQAYSRAAFQSLLALLEERGRTLEGARVLDFGCGTGLLTAAMAERAAHVTGLDLSRPMIDVLAAKSLPNVTALTGSLQDHALPPFDLITCSSVLAFVDDYPATVAALGARLAPGGLLVQWDWELDPTAEEPFGLARGTIQQALGAAGLSEVTVRVGFDVPFEQMRMRPLLGFGLRARGVSGASPPG